MVDRSVTDQATALKVPSKRAANNYLHSEPGILSLAAGHIVLEQRMLLVLSSGRVKFGRELHPDRQLFSSPIAPSEAFINPL
jgi:hypothetical protein